MDVSLRRLGGSVGVRRAVIKRGRGVAISSVSVVVFAVSSVVVARRVARGVAGPVTAAMAATAASVSGKGSWEGMLISHASKV